MITLIYGPKGSGKTKKIIDAANDSVNTTKGSTVFVGDSKYTNQISTSVRFFNSREYDIVGKDMTIGFIKGILAGNYDITEFFIDGLHRIAGCATEDLKDVFDAIEYLAVQDDVHFTVTISTDKLPEFLKKYI